jgi:hypothetical protein
MLVSSSTWDFVLVSDSGSGAEVAASSFLVFSALVALLVLGVLSSGFGRRQGLRVRCDDWCARLGDGGVGGTIEVWIEVVESLHPVVLHERFKVAVEEEVQQMRVLDFGEAIEFLELCQWCPEPCTGS